MLLVAVLYVISLSLAIIGMLEGALYWLGERFGEVDAELGEMGKRFERVEEGARGLGGFYARTGLGDASAERRELELPVGEGAIKPEKADAAKGGTERPAAGNFSAKEGRNRLKQLSGRDVDESTYEEALELRLARKTIREYGQCLEAWGLHHASIAVGLALQ